MTFSNKGTQSGYIIWPIHQLLLMDELCINYNKTCFKNSERIFKAFFHVVFLEICKLFELLPKGFSTKKIMCFGKPSEELEKECKNGIDELNARCRDLLFQEHFKKLFNLMDIFWCDIKYKELDITWLLKVKTHIDKLEKIQSKIKRKKLRNLSTNSLPKKLVFERFDEYLLFFKFKYDFNEFCYSNFPDFENLYTLLTINKGSGVLELVIILKVARMSLWFVILLSLRGERMR